MVSARFAGLAGATLVCAGCCGNVQTTTWQGTLQFNFPSSASLDADAGTGASADGGADGGVATPPNTAGSLVTTVALDAFAPWVQNTFAGGYCGSNDFTVVIAPGCQLSATLGATDYQGKYASDTGSATIDPGQTCTLTTGSGTFSVPVQGGNLAISGGEVNILLDTPNANIEFEGNLQ
jgi:hypothetical protein